MASQYDLIILGGGCAGLSLASRLARPTSRALRVLLLESRTHYSNDRTWCFWDRIDNTFCHLVSKRWSEYAVQQGESRVVCACPDSPYQMIRADTFYQHALEALFAAANIQLELGVSCDRELTSHQGFWSVETSKGIRLGKMVVDTRPRCDLRPEDATLWQSFYGHEVRSDRPLFNPSCVELMHFWGSDKSCVQFIYVLPISSYQALVELTVFDRVPWARTDLTDDLHSAVVRWAGTNTPHIVRSEYGFLPMGSLRRPQQQHASFVKAGVTSGGARPSSGYAFQRIQRWADRCSHRLAAGHYPVGHAPDPPLLKTLDSLFVSVLRRDPARAPELFFSLNRKADTPGLIRFMSDKGTIGDFARIVAALPPLPFLREVPRAFLNSIRTEPRETGDIATASRRSIARRREA